MNLYHLTSAARVLATVYKMTYTSIALYWLVKQGTRERPRDRMLK